MDRRMLWLLGSLALVAAGFAWGRMRRPTPHVDARRRPLALWLLYGLIGFPVVVIVLAKLFDSAVLGWVFGLSLLFDVLLVPCCVLVAIGYGPGRWSRPRAVPSVDDLVPPTLSIRVDRDTVHASDDGDERTLATDPRFTLAMLLRQLRDSAYLPSIHGGRATWVVTTSALGERPVAVTAQQWPEARLALPDASLGSHFHDVEPVIRFTYLGQRPPESALDRP